VYVAIDPLDKIDRQENTYRSRSTLKIFELLFSAILRAAPEAIDTTCLLVAEIFNPQIQPTFLITPSGEHL
jgi:hypothetical protein